MNQSPSLLLALAFLTTGCGPGKVVDTKSGPRTLHVSDASGNDANTGTQAAPFKTISAAARVAMPGETVLVHAGVYRERVDPPRGGTSEALRITYAAVPGENVVITGSEPAKDWQKVEGDVWKLTIPSASFGNFNPYSDVIRGDWFTPKGRTHHTGCVYLNGDWMIEATTLDQVMKPAVKTPLWFATVDGADGGYLMNLAKVKPSAGTAVSGGEPSFRYGGKVSPNAEGGTCSGHIQNGHWLRFDNVDFGVQSASVDLRAAALANAGGLVELRLDNPAGEFLGKCEITPTGDWQKWQEFTAVIKPLSGRNNLCLVFKGAKVDAGNTTIHAQFPGVNPNEAKIEINKRQTVFYPSKNHINYITVRGFTLENAATNWAPPSSEQTAIIGTNWSKGWIIENNTVRHSKCSGISLGKYGDGTDNTNDDGSADPYTACVRRALANGWNKETIGGHIVRDNHVHHCEQTGIVGSMGCAFSKVTGNDVHDIHTRKLFSGWEQAGIKFHGAVDAVVSGNHVHDNGSFGVWLDWMAQGSQVTGNFMHANAQADFFCEMQHGPMVVANNIFLSPDSFFFNAKSIAVVHNLVGGAFNNQAFDARNTPFHPAHSTEIAGLADAPNGDHRVLNNVFIGNRAAHWGGGLDGVRLPCVASGNVFIQGAKPSKFDVEATVDPGFDAKMKVTRKDDGWYLTMAGDKSWRSKAKCQPVTAAVLGKAKIPNLPYENADGSPVAIDTDYFGGKRDGNTPFPGPFESPGDGVHEVKVWPVGAAGGSK